MRFNNEADFLAVWLKETMYIKGNLFHFLKWSPMFKAGIEAPIVPCKIQFPHSPVNFYNENLIRSIAGNVEKVLKIDLASLQVTFAIAATITMEVDLQHFLPDRIELALSEMVSGSRLNVSIALTTAPLAKKLVTVCSIVRSLSVD